MSISAQPEAAANTQPAQNQTPNSKTPKGQTLVAGFRAARIAGKTTLHAEITGLRAALRAQRRARLGLDPAPPSPAPDITPEPAGPTPPPSSQAAAPQDGSSLFAQMINISSQERSPAPACETAATDTSATTSDAAIQAPEQPSSSPPVTAMGFGPGMAIRFRHIGIETIADLAATDAAELREALGDISRLINVDAWISSARNAQAGA